MPRQPIPFGNSQNLPTREWKFDGFNLAVNTFSLYTELAGQELGNMINGEVVGKRSIRPRRGGSLLGAGLGGSSVDALLPFRQGSDNDFYGISGGNIKKYNSGTDEWDTIVSAAFTANLRTRGVKIKGKYFLGNGTDDETNFDGTTASTATAVAAPTGLGVTPQGTPGTSKYSYSITTVTDKGQSLPSTEVDITTGAEALDETDFNRVVFNRRTESNVIGYNVFGRTAAAGRTLMKFIAQPASGATVTYDDIGNDMPGNFLEPEGDSTDGLKFSIVEQLRGSIIAAGVTGEEHRLFYTGTGANYASWSPAYNGGWVDVREGDNDLGITGLAPLEQNIIVTKENSIHQFTFSASTGDAVLQELITYVGCAAPGSIVVMENDLAFVDAERKFRILGYEPNYTAGYRTTSISESRVDSLFGAIDPDKLSNLEAVYFKGRYYLAYTPQGQTSNSEVLVYDRKYLAFLGKWTGADCHVKCWAVWNGVDGRKRLYAGGSDSDDVWEMETQLPEHDNTAVEFSMLTRNEDLKNPGQQKIWKWLDMRLYQISGSLTLRIILDGTRTLVTKSFSSTYRSGWGVKRWGTTRWGLSTGTPASSSDLDRTYRREIYEPANSMQFELTKSGAQDDFTLVSMRGEALMLPTEVFDTNYYI